MPDFIHYILIFKKEPVFPFSMLSAKLIFYGLLTCHVSGYTRLLSYNDIHNGYITLKKG